MITVIQLKVGQEPDVIEIKNTLESFQKCVQGYIEVVPFQIEGNTYVIVANEEGILKRLKPNRMLFGRTLVGDILIAKANEDEFVSLTNDDVKLILSDLNLRL